MLVTATGEAVLSAAGKPIPVPPGDVSVGGDGVVSVAGGVVATIGLFTFAPGVQLSAEGANRYVAPEGVKPLPATQATLHEGALEGANESVIKGTMEMILAQREAEMMQKALTIFYTDFNKTATEDLPRV
jgi:flagellar basal-body rod protein FlgF/flagellar basal-body rod protein FlgG